MQGNEVELADLTRGMRKNDFVETEKLFFLAFRFPIFSILEGPVGTRAKQAYREDGPMSSK